MKTTKDILKARDEALKRHKGKSAAWKRSWHNGWLRAGKIIQNSRKR